MMVARESVFSERLPPDHAPGSTEELCMQPHTEKRAAFPEAEHRSRLLRARRAMRDEGIDVVISFAAEHIYYFTGYDGHTQFSIQCVIFGADDGEATLVLRDVDA